MKSSIVKSLVIAGALTLAAVPALASLMKDVTDAPSRYSGPGVYTGAPALPVTLSMVIAGGGPSDFKTQTLVGVLAGDKASAEVAKLTKQYGATKVTNFVKTFDFVVSDTLAIVRAKGITLPSTPNPDPKDGRAVATALWGAGQTGEGFSVEVMLDRAVSHGIHDQVMDDIDANPKLGKAADADYHLVLSQAMKDLASVYGLKTAM